MKQNLDEIKKAWSNELDEFVLKAITENSSDYSKDVLEIIINEAARRKLIKEKDGTSFSLNENGKEIKAEICLKNYNRRPTVIVRRLVYSIIVISIASICAAYISIGNESQNEKIVMYGIGIPAVGLLAIIWGCKNPITGTEPINPFKEEKSQTGEDIIINKKRKTRRDE